MEQIKKNIDVIKILKICLSIASLICLLDMPYGYYQLYRLVACVIFGYLAINSNDDAWIILWGISALLVQPFFKFALGREIWNIVDLVFAVVLLISLRKSD